MMKTYSLLDTQNIKDVDEANNLSGQDYLNFVTLNQIGIQFTGQ